MYGLQFSDIYTRIKDYANINNVVNADTKAKRAANDALRLIATLRNWEILKREATLTPTASTAAYTVTTSAASFGHIISCWYLSNGVRVPIDVVDDDLWNKQSDSNDDGIPQICRVTMASGTEKIEFSPRPSASFISLYTSIYFDYVKKPTELSGDTDIPEIPGTSQQMALVYLGVSDLLGKQGDLKGMTSWEAKATRLLNTAHKIDDKKQGRAARMGKPLIPIGLFLHRRSIDY
ncbi:MAG: hypothetical protein KKH44_11955 [Bacteroidetes bacterium]|nr:hypothetical protein [Bacteroidota bacterium]